MDNENIKEILEFDFQSQGERIEVNEYERDILKDYITNLQEENNKYKNVIDKIKEIINKQLLSNTNLTKYTDEMCLRDILELLEEVE